MNLISIQSIHLRRWNKLSIELLCNQQLYFRSPENNQEQKNALKLYGNFHNLREFIRQLWFLGHSSL